LIGADAAKYIQLLVAVESPEYDQILFGPTHRVQPNLGRG